MYCLDIVIAHPQSIPPVMRDAKDDKRNAKKPATEYQIDPQILLCRQLTN